MVRVCFVSTGFGHLVVIESTSIYNKMFEKEKTQDVVVTQTRFKC